MSQCLPRPRNPQAPQTVRPTVPVFFALLVLALCCCIPAAAADPPANHAKTQVLLYVVGSDLETESGTGTADLQEIAGSYENTDPSQLDIIVAFGGAKNPGWQGMKIATIEQLLDDAKDEKFGNGQYLYSDSNADMGSGQSLSRFLSVARTSRPADRTILIVSDHGASYDGIGVDDNTKNSLMLGDLDCSLRESGMTYEPIMFDACLMASLEVAKTVQPYTRVMLGSEEIQRGSYEYTYLIQPLITNPETDAVTLARTLVDSYVDSKTPAGKSKTMAIIDVTKIPAIKTSLDKLGEELIPVTETDQGLYDLKGAYNDAIRLGVTNGESPTSVDLVSLLQNIKKKRPEVSPQVDTVIGQIRGAVIYERHNDYSQAVSGISIASPDAMDTSQYTRYGDGVKIAPNWDLVFQKVVAVSHDGSSGTGSKMAVSGSSVSDDDEEDNEERDKSPAKLPGFVARGNGSFELRDPYNMAEVYTVYYQVNGADAISLGAQPLSPDQTGQYHIPAWDGRWYYFPATRQVFPPPKYWMWKVVPLPVKMANPLLVDLEYEGTSVGGHTMYTSWISIREGRDLTNATLVTYVNGSTGTIETMHTPYTVTDEGNELFGIGVDRFNDGAVVTSHAPGFNVRTLDKGDYDLSSTTVTPGMTMAYTLLPDGTYATGIMAYYDNDAEVLADEFRFITIKNGALADTTVRPING